MAEARRIRKVVKSRPTIEGAGVHLHRAIGFSRPELYDPFLLLDDFRSDVPAEYVKGFPWHPHRGMETITYVLRGEVAHGDSLGNEGVIAPGDVQWMTAGSGIIHQEMPQGDAQGSMHGFQLWANLPAADKMMEPRYRGVAAAEIPVVTDAGGATVRVIAGAVAGVTGPVRDVVTGPEYLDVTVPAGASFTHATPRGHTVFAYVIGGRGVFCRQTDPYSYEEEGENYFDMERDGAIGDRHLLLFGDGDVVTVTAAAAEGAGAPAEDAAPAAAASGGFGPNGSPEGAASSEGAASFEGAASPEGAASSEGAAARAPGVRFLLVSGRPIGEPIAWYGPIVMNTQEELRVAFEELRRGTFIRHGRGPR